MHMIKDVRIFRHPPVFAACLVFLATFAAGHSVWSAESQLSARVKYFGLVEDTHTGTKDAPLSPSGKTGLVKEYKFIKETTEIDACPGTSFGVENELDRLLSRDDEPIFMRFEYPEQTTPDGRVFSTHNMPLSGDSIKVYTGFTFDYQWEMVSGDWTFRLMQGTRELSVKTFKVRVGPCLVS
jgi:hypothetical protein